MDKATKVTVFFIVISVSTSVHIVTAHPYEAAQPQVLTNYGTVRGCVMTSRNGRFFAAFRGIPYAKPPVGELRFANPQKPEPWEFPLDATKDGPYCIQKNYFFKDPKVEGTEDCLYLNVYSPRIESYSYGRAAAELLPVMVFIHWGGFFAGRGTSDYLGPEYFMDQDVIIVTFNYRLGVLGFLTTLDDNAPGNYALKDQVAALRWINENILYFGGDPDKVTIFGQSAGAGSVHLHLLSPSSKGLFSGAISQSGTALALWAKPTNFIQPNVTAAQAQFVGCTEHIGNNAKLIECLRSVDAQTLVATGDLFKTFDVEPLTAFGVVTEVESPSNPEPFITEEPLKYIQRRQFHSVPWISGGVQDEGILRAAPLLRKSKIREELNKNFSTIMPAILLLQLSAGNDADSLWKNISDFYFSGHNSIDIGSAASIQGLTDLYSDRAFQYPQYQSVMLHSAKGHKPLWLYNFNYRGQYSYGDLFAATDETIDHEWGVSHCDELLYLFHSPGLFPDLTDPKDILVSQQMVELWTNFAKYRVPWVEGPDLFGQVFDPHYWKPVAVDENMRNEDLYYLDISGSSVRAESPIHYEYKNGFLTKRMQFWESQKLAENFPGLN